MTKNTFFTEDELNVREYYYLERILPVGSVVSGTMYTGKTVIGTVMSYKRERLYDGKPALRLDTGDLLALHELTSFDVRRAVLEHCEHINWNSGKGTIVHCSTPAVGEKGLVIRKLQYSASHVSVARLDTFKIRFLGKTRNLLKTPQSYV